MVIVDAELLTLLLLSSAAVLTLLLLEVRVIISPVNAVNGSDPRICGRAVLGFRLLLDESSG